MNSWYDQTQKCLQYDRVKLSDTPTATVKIYDMYILAGTTVSENVIRNSNNPRLLLVIYMYLRMHYKQSET